MPEGAPAVTITPYIDFDGNCRQAMLFYAEVFGSPAPQILTYENAPKTPDMPEMPPNQVMHAVVQVGGIAIMGADGNPDEPKSSRVSIVYSPADAATGRAVFDRLAEGGEVRMPFEETFFSTGFGMVRDRFGVSWMIAGPDKEQA